MDSSTTALIVTQSMTFLALVISETLPFTPAPYNGIMQFILLLLGGTVVSNKNNA